MIPFTMPYSGIYVTTYRDFIGIWRRVGDYTQDFLDSSLYHTEETHYNWWIIHRLTHVVLTEAFMTPSVHAIVSCRGPGGCNEEWLLGDPRRIKLGTYRRSWGFEPGVYVFPQHSCAVCASAHSFSLGPEWYHIIGISRCWMITESCSFRRPNSWWGPILTSSSLEHRTPLASMEGERLAVVCELGLHDRK